MKNRILFLFAISILFWSCDTKPTTIETYGKHYQENNDFASLNKVVELMQMDVDTAYVKSILGEPIDMGFDYRYLVDSVGEKGCVIGAVFHINETGNIDQKWIDEICE